jgi:hypothetical protein
VTNALQPVRRELQRIPDTLLVFLDETGDEQYADPKHPVFGIGGCAMTSHEYGRLSDAWSGLKAGVLGLGGQFFHAVDFERSHPTPEQISAINHFLTRGFYRLAVTTDINTTKPEGYDGHETVSTVIFEYIRRLIARHLSRYCMVFFEQTDRGVPLLERNLPVHTMDAGNLIGERVVPDGYTMPESSLEAGLEIADLIIHTSGKQQRKYARDYAAGAVRDFTLDFRAVFHSVDTSWSLYHSVVSMEPLNEKQVMVEHWPHY